MTQIALPEADPRFVDTFADGAGRQVCIIKTGSKYLERLDARSSSSGLTIIVWRVEHGEAEKAEFQNITLDRGDAELLRDLLENHVERLTDPAIQEAADG